MRKQAIILLVLLSWFGFLCGCDMFALLLKEGCSFADCEEEVNFYFDYLTTRSSNATNNDGYGIIAYREGEPRLEEGDYWYKTGTGTWYGDGEPDILDDARVAILDADNHYFLVIGHARNASVGAGSHPFRLESEELTISMCHNGVMDSSLLAVFMEYLGEVWFEEYPSNWSGEYGNIGSFIDSELYFHYLAKEIIGAEGDVMTGICNALEETDLLGESVGDVILGGGCSANFLLADGEALYGFRNSSTTSTAYKLSWEEYPGMFAVKTQTYLSNIFQQNELIAFRRNGETASVILAMEEDEEEDIIPVSDFYAHPNPFSEEVDLVFREGRKDDNGNDDTKVKDIVKVYNLKGEYLRMLAGDPEKDGYSYFHWDGYTYEGKKAATGIYLFQHQQSGRNTKAVFLK